MSQNIDILLKSSADLAGFKATNAASAELQRMFDRFGKNVFAPLETGLGKVDTAIKTKAGAWERTIDNIGKKFSGNDIFKQFLGGFGIGSGFAIAERASDLMVGHFRTMAEEAKKIEDATAQQLDYQRQLKALRQSDAQNAADVKRDAAKVRSDLQAAQAQKFETVYTDRGESIDVPRAHTKAERDQVTALSAEYDKLTFAVGKLDIKQQEVAVSNALVDFFHDLDVAAKTAGNSVAAATDLGIALAASRLEALQNEIEQGNKLYLKSEEERREAIEKTRLAAIELDFALAEGRRKAIEEEIRQGNELYLAKQAEKPKKEPKDEIGNTVQSGASDFLFNLTSGAETFENSWLGAIQSVGQSFLRMITDTVAKLIWKGKIDTALTASGVATHAAGETAKTTATGTGFLARLGFRIKEAMADVYGGAVAAFKAMAGIPYFGPFVAAAAMAAALAGGIALVSKIGGFEQGGFPVGRDALVRVNENGQESILNARATSMLGSDFINSINAGQFVPFARPLVPPSGDSFAGGGGGGGGGTRLLRPVFVGSMAEAESIRRGSKAEVQILQMVRANRYKIFGSDV